MSAGRGRGRAGRASAAESAIIHLALLATILVFGAPFLWVIAAAFDAGAGSYVPWPSAPTLANFADLFRTLGFGRALRASLIVATATAALAVLAASLAGYGLSRLTWRGREGLAAGLLLLQTMPLAATMVPIYDLARRLGLRNSYLGLVLAHAAIALPVLIWLMKGFFDAVPPEIEEAAWLDGASRGRAWLGVLLPVARTGVGVAAGLAFLSAWAEVLLVLVLVDPDAGKETVALAFYRTYQRAGPLSDVRYEVVAAMGILYVLPVLALLLGTRRFLLDGPTRTRADR